MKSRMLLTALAVVLAASVAMAQPGGGQGQGGPAGGGPAGPGGGGMMMGAMPGLDLTPEQETKIAEIRTKYMKEMQDAAPEARREMFQKMRDEFNSVLTAEQKAKMAEMRPGTGMGPAGMPGRGAFERPGMFSRVTGSLAILERMVERLNLTPEQREKITKLHQDAMEKLYKQIHDEVLTKEQQKQVDDARAQAQERRGAAAAPAVEAKKEDAKNEEAKKPEAAPAEKPQRQRRARQQ